MEEAGEVIKFITSTGPDGKEYPRARKPRTVYVPEDPLEILEAAKEMEETDNIYQFNRYQRV